MKTAIYSLRAPNPDSKGSPALPTVTVSPCWLISQLSVKYENAQKGGYERTGPSGSPRYLQIPECYHVHISKVHTVP